MCLEHAVDEYSIESRYLGCFISCRVWDTVARWAQMMTASILCLDVVFRSGSSTKKSVHLQENSSVNMLEGIVGSPN